MFRIELDWRLTVLTARVVDHRVRIQEMLNAKIGAACKAAADRLADSYVAGLQAQQAPEHSVPGQIPFRYDGHKEGGFGPVHLPLQANNTPLSPQRYASVQSDFLATYIESGFGNNNGSVVGFAPSHVARRSQNYLLQWNDGTTPEQPGVTRPWVKPIYDFAKQDMVADAVEALKTSVPF